MLAHGSVRDAGRVDELLAGARVADAYLGGLDLIEDAGAAEDGTAISVQNVDERGP